MATKKATKAPKPKKKRTRRKARRNPGGELATIMLANPGGTMPKKRRGKKRRRRASAGAHSAAPVRKVRRRRRKTATPAAGHVVRKHGTHRRRARRNPEDGISDVLVSTVGATVGVVGARYVQNLTAMKMGSKDRAQASKPLHIALGALAPAALGLALHKLAGKKKLGNALVTGGLVFGVHELLRSFVFSKAEQGSPLYPLSGWDDYERMGELAMGDDGQEYAYLPDRGWMRIAELPAPQRAQVRRQLQAPALSGMALRDQLGSLQVRDQLGDELDGLSVRDQLGGIAVRDQLGDEYLGAEEDLGEEEMGAEEDLGAGDEWSSY